MKQSAHPAKDRTRELTTLENVILGFLAFEPQSGYAMMNNLETGVYRASASTGSVYPVLKRLEKLGLISSLIEAVYETRPRKVYKLLPSGEAVLDEWLRRDPTIAEVIEAYDLAMHKFLIAEFRLSRAEVLAWLGGYEAVVEATLAIHAALDQATKDEPGLSLHAQLIREAIILEIQARRAWIQAARARLTAE